MKRAIIAIVLGVLVVGFNRQTAPAISAANLRRDLSAFADDSMLGRYTGSTGVQRATAFIVGRLESAGVKATLQAVPIVIRQLDLERAKGGDNGYYVPGVDFLPLIRAFGVATPESATVRGTYVPAGELGSSGAAKPGDVSGELPVFLAPTRANGIPDYQLWDKREAILSYRGAAALFIATLDLMPRSFIDEMVGPRMDLRERVASRPTSPPIVAFTRGAARKAVGSVNQALTYRTVERALSYPAQNIVAVVEGSDATLRSEFFVLSANIDHLGRDSAVTGRDSVFNGANAGSGAIALLAIAEDLASRPRKPQRSIVFVWTTGSVQGFLGAEFFADNPAVAREKIVSSITVDRIARPLTESGVLTHVQVTGSQWLSTELSELVARATPGIAIDQVRDGRKGLPESCAGDEWHFARWGIPSARITGHAHATDNVRSDDVESINFSAYAHAVGFIAGLAEHIANVEARPKLDVAKPDQRTSCAR